MAIGDRGWSDRKENYADGYAIRINGTTATGLVGRDLKQPVVVYSLTVSTQATTTGDVALVDGTATGDSGDTRKLRLHFMSAANGNAHCEFPRGLTFDKGVIVSATTIDGTVSMTFKPRYE